MRRLIAVLCLAALAGCGPKGGEKAAAGAAADPAPEGVVAIPADSPKLRQIRVAPVGTAQVPVDETVAPGKIETNPNRVSRVALPVAGRVAAVMVRIGDAVRQGDPLVSIDSPDADAAVSAFLQGQAAVAQARANLLKADADHDRLADLFQHNAVARKEVLTAENAVAQARAAVEQSQAALEQAQRKLDLLGLQHAFGQKVVVTAPSSGKVLEMSVAPGEYRNDTNTPIITIADLSTVWVSADVPESSIRFVQVGERIDVTLSAYPGEAFRGRVTRIADTVDPQTRTVKVRAELDNSHGRLRPEMFGSIRHTEAIRTMPVLPPGAVVQGDGRSVVFVEEAPGRFRQTDVKVGPRAGDLLPVLAGVKPGDRVVVDGAMLLKAQ